MFTALRAFTMVEISVVAAIVGVVALAATLGIANLVQQNKREARLKATYLAVQQLRARHLSFSSQAISCMQLSAPAGVLVVDERNDCATAGARPENISLPLPIRMTASCVDNLGRAVRCDDVTISTDFNLELEADGTPGPSAKDGLITWKDNGKLLTSFNIEDIASADHQPHLADVSSRDTPNPTARGTYDGAATDPRGLLE